MCFFATSVTELSLIMLIVAKLSFCVRGFCVLTVWSARLYKTHRLPSAARENTYCADWVEELYILGSWINVIKICLRFVDVLLVSKWEPQQSSCFLQPSKLHQYYRHWQPACKLHRLPFVRQNICLGQQYDGCDGVMICLLLSIRANKGCFVLRILNARLGAVNAYRFTKQSHFRMVAFLRKGCKNCSSLLLIRLRTQMIHNKKECTQEIALLASLLFILRITDFKKAITLHS